MKTIHITLSVIYLLLSVGCIWQAIQLGSGKGEWLSVQATVFFCASSVLMFCGEKDEN